jgi:hypothetical protein
MCNTTFSAIGSEHYPSTSTSFMHLPPKCCSDRHRFGEYWVLVAALEYEKPVVAPKGNLQNYSPIITRNSRRLPS